MGDWVGAGGCVDLEGQSQGRIHVQVTMVAIRMVGRKLLEMVMIMMIMMILMSHWQAV